MKYESAILKRLIDTYGVVGNPRYISEIIKEFIVRGKECFPNLFTYQSDWLAHIDEFGLKPSYTVSYTGQSIYAPNTLEKPVKSAILKGSTKYLDIDTGDILDAFDESKNLELVSVKMPVLTSSNEDGTKTNILTVNEDVELRGVGNVKDELDLMTGELTERIGEVVLDENNSTNFILKGISDNTLSFWCLHNASSPFVNISKGEDLQTLLCDKIARKTNFNEDVELIHSGTGAFVLRILKNKLQTQDINGLTLYLQSNPITVQYKLATESVKTVGLTILDQNGQNVKQLMSFNGGTHFNTKSSDGSPLPLVSVSVETDLEETLKVCSIEGNTM